MERTIFYEKKQLGVIMSNEDSEKISVNILIEVMKDKLKNLSSQELEEKAESSLSSIKFFHIMMMCALEEYSTRPESSDEFGGNIMYKFSEFIADICGKLIKASIKKTLN